MEELGRILIAGGGIAGLTLATAMRRRGFEPELVERSATWEALGAGIAVQPNGMRALRDLGIDTAIERAGAVVRRWLFRDRCSATSIWGVYGAMWALSLVLNAPSCKKRCSSLPAARTTVSEFTSPG